MHVIQVNILVIDAGNILVFSLLAESTRCVLVSIAMYDLAYVVTFTAGISTSVFTILV